METAIRNAIIKFEQEFLGRGRTTSGPVSSVIWWSYASRGS